MYVQNASFNVCRFDDINVNKFTILETDEVLEKKLVILI